MVFFDIDIFKIYWKIYIYIFYDKKNLEKYLPYLMISKFYQFVSNFKIFLFYFFNYNCCFLLYIYIFKFCFK